MKHWTELLTLWNIGQKSSHYEKGLPSEGYCQSSKVLVLLAEKSILLFSPLPNILYLGLSGSGVYWALKRMRSHTKGFTGWLGHHDFLLLLVIWSTTTECIFSASYHLDVCFRKGAVTLALLNGIPCRYMWVEPVLTQLNMDFSQQYAPFFIVLIINLQNPI